MNNKSINYLHFLGSILVHDSTTIVTEPQEATFDPIGVTGKMSDEEKREPQTSSTPRTRPATSIMTTTSSRTTEEEVFQG